MKKGDILIAPEGCAEYLTPFKEYEVKKVDILSKSFGWFVVLINDNGDGIFTSQNRSAHINRQDWIIKSEAEKEWNDLNGLIQLTEEQAKRKEYLIKVLKK